MKTINSNVWPYVIAGSAVGGAVGYLFMTESGRRIRRKVTHPDELATHVEQAGDFLQRKARVITGQVHGAIDKARRSLEEGERAYHEAEERYRARARRVETTSSEITSRLHHTIDTMGRSAVTLEHNVLDAVSEAGALYRGVEGGIRALLGKTGRRSAEGPVSVSGSGWSWGRQKR
jgi:hypothetical protein